MARPKFPPKALALLSLGGILLAAGCADLEVTSPMTRGGPALSQASSGGKAAVVQNAVRYSDTGAKPATGRSGSAQLTVRALLGKDGKTQLEVTTGALDGGNAPGNLAKVQVKGFAPNDSLVTTENYNGLTGGGYASFTYERYGRDDRIQVQGNVTGIDRNRTGVVTVSTQVKRRPDLSTISLTAPASALVNTNVIINATVQELNGDVGATANCVLYVNGTQVDQANGIWVDAGDVVDCSFGHTFTSVGEQSLRVAVENVVPGDDDASNDDATGTITIVEPTVPLQGYAQAHDEIYSYNRNYSYSDWYWGSGSGSHTEHGRQQWVNLHSWANEAAVGAPAHLKVSETSDGTSRATIDFALTGWDYSDSWQSCVSRYSPVDNAWAHACTYPQSNHTWLQYNRHAADVVYYGYNAYYSYYYYYGYYYSYYYPYSGHTQVGSFSSFGADVKIEVDFGNASKRFVASPTVPLTVSPISDNWSGCWSYWYSYQCESVSKNGTRAAGATSF